MSEPYNDSLARLLELASLPPGDPRRNELDHELSLMPEADRTRWTRMMHETDLLYHGLPQVDVPPDLEAKLLRIPAVALAAAAPATSAPTAPSAPADVRAEEPAPAPLAKIGPRRWKLYAACLLILLPIAGISLWNMPPAGPTPPSYVLDPIKANDIIALAEASHEATPPLDVTSSDPKIVQAALDTAMKPYAMPFPAMVLPPKTPLTLQGGGVVPFGKTHAAFTRWTDGKSTYTLFQFDGKPLDVPAGFTKTIASGRDRHYISIWPGYGYPCTWALVADTKPGAEVFD